MRAVADALRIHPRASDQLFRLGGGEFMVVPAHAGENEAQSSALRPQETLADRRMWMDQDKAARRREA